MDAPYLLCTSVSTVAFMGDAGFPPPPWKKIKLKSISYLGLTVSMGFKPAEEFYQALGQKPLCKKGIPGWRDWVC